MVSISVPLMLRATVGGVGRAVQVYDAIAVDVLVDIVAESSRFLV